MSLWATVLNPRCCESTYHESRQASSRGEEVPGGRSGKQHRVGGPLRNPLAPFVAHAGRKMAALLMLLFGLGALFVSSDAQGAYDKLPETYRKGVDLALEKLHSHAGIQHHFRFFRSIDKSDIEAGFDVTYIYHHFYLKATKCPRGTVDATSCRFRNDRVRFVLFSFAETFFCNLFAKASSDSSMLMCVCVCVQPVIDCAVCYKTFGGGIEQEPKPYVHCVHKPALTEEMTADRVNHCNAMGYSSGAPTLLASARAE
uniref:Retinoic acid receptor responder protein 2 n=1 Tax=Gasterosteus aculeatus aculeatus TaxID=481459 RepID=A0AAQ4PNU7_GASAC